MASMHPLKAWIDENTTQVRFAREVACSEAHLSDILNGKKGVSLDLAVRISRATGGLVTVDALAARMPRRAA